MKLVIAEPESPALHRYLRLAPDRASCALARVEVSEPCAGMVGPRSREHGGYSQRLR